jgi:hypothetical protein
MGLLGRLRVYGVQVLWLYLLESAVPAYLSILHPECATAESGQHWVIMACGDDDAAGFDDRLRSLLKEVPELMVERLVHFVQE